MSESIQELIKLTADRIPVKAMVSYLDTYCIKINVVRVRIQEVAAAEHNSMLLFNRPPADAHRNLVKLVDQLVDDLRPEYGKYKDLVEYLRGLRTSPGDAQQALAGLDKIIGRLQAVREQISKTKGGCKLNIIKIL